MATFDPKEIIVLVTLSTGAPIIVRSFTKDSIAEADRNSPTYKNGVDATGNFTWFTKVNDKTGSIKISVMQSSPECIALSAAQLADENSKTNLIQSIAVTDLSGSSLASANDVRMEKPAKVDLKEDLTTREFTFLCNDLKLLN